jgi:uncharacterized protein (TIGR02217 family)
MDSGFHDVVWSHALSFGSISGVQFNTDIVTMNSGFERRNTRWRNGYRRFDLRIGPIRLSDMTRLKAFFDARQGRLNGFLFRDWIDNHTGGVEPSATDEVLTASDDSRQVFHLHKTYGAITKRVFKPQREGFRLAIDGTEKQIDTDYSLDTSNGSVRLLQPLGRSEQLSVGFWFYIPVRFDTDFLAIELVSFETARIASLPLVELAYEVSA